MTINEDAAREAIEKIIIEHRFDSHAGQIANYILSALKALPEEGPRVEDMAMLIRGLVHAVGTDRDISNQAMDYLERYGLQGSPLRNPAPPAEKEET